jgi:hypothetical protein
MQQTCFNPTIGICIMRYAVLMRNVILTGEFRDPSLDNVVETLFDSDAYSNDGKGGIQQSFTDGVVMWAWPCRLETSGAYTNAQRLHVGAYRNSTPTSRGRS